MEPDKCNKCSALLAKYEGKLCSACRNRQEEQAVELRAVYERAYFAVLPILSKKLTSDVAVQASAVISLETVRQWPAMMAELEQEIAK